MADPSSTMARLIAQDLDPLISWPSDLCFNITTVLFVQVHSVKYNYFETEVVYAERCGAVYAARF
jgi:hypothetical protein